MNARAIILEFIAKRHSGDVPDDLDLFESGIMDSFSLVQLIQLLEREVSIDFSMDDMMSPEIASVAGILSIVGKKMEAS